MAPMFTNLPPVTRALLVANAIAYALQWMLGNGVFAPFMLWPLGDAGYDPYRMSLEFLPWQLLTYGFLHRDPVAGRGDVAADLLEVLHGGRLGKNRPAW